MAEKSYLIKVPVFTTSSFECTEDEIFGYTYQTMIDDHCCPLKMWTVNKS